jgi:hypothetical protein
MHQDVYNQINEDDYGRDHCTNSPAYQLPADYNRGRNPARRNVSNASVQTARTGRSSTVCVQTCSPAARRGSSCGRQRGREVEREQERERRRSVPRDDLSSRGSSMFDMDKHISACSSESAAASFDVRMFPNVEDDEDNGEFPACDIPDPVIDSEMFLSQISGQSFSSLPSLEVANLMLPPATPNEHTYLSPVRTSPRKRPEGRLPPPSSFRTVLQQHFGNTAFLLTQEPNSTDITPDSAVVADISQSSACMEENSSYMENAPFVDDSLMEDDDVHSKRSVASSISDFWKMSTRSINDLFKSSPVRQSRRRAKDILDRLQGSNFSLNSAKQKQYSALGREEAPSVSSLKRFCSEYEVHLAEMDSVLSAEMNRMTREEDDHGLTGAVGRLEHEDFRLAGYHPGLELQYSSAQFQSLKQPKEDRRWRDYDTQTDDYQSLLVQSPGSPQKTPMSNGIHLNRPTSIELLDSMNKDDGEDYGGEADVTVDPNLLKAKILKVCDNIRQFSDSGPPFRSRTGRQNVESAF